MVRGVPAMQKINSQSGNKSTLSEFALGLILAGHGPPTTLAEVARFREMLVELRAAVDCTIKAGASEAAAMQEVTLPQYAHVQRYKKWMPLDVRAAYRYLRGVWGIPKFSEPTTVAGRPLICDWWQSGATTHGTYPTLAARVATSRSCQNRTHAVQQKVIRLPHRQSQAILMGSQFRGRARFAS